MFCTGCGNEFGEHAAFCTNCGTRREDMAPNPEPVEASESAEGPESVTSVAASPDLSAACAACGHEMAPGSGFCTNCGTPAALAPTPGPVPPTMAVASDAIDDESPGPAGAVDDMGVVGGDRHAEDGEFAVVDPGPESSDEAVTPPQSDAASDDMATAAADPVAIPDAVAELGPADDDAAEDTTIARNEAAVVGPAASGAACTACGHLMGASDVFCIECGTRRTTEAVPEAAALDVAAPCTSCGAPMEGDDAFCTSCGIPRAVPPMKASEVVPPAVDVPTDVPSAEDVRPRDEDTLATAELSPPEVVPAAALAAEATLEMPEVAAADAAAGQPLQPCAVCGAGLEPDDAFCTNCGTSRDLTAEEAAVPAAVPLVSDGAEAPRRRRSALVLVGILGLALVAVGGWFAWQTWFAADDDADAAEAAVTTTIAAPEDIEGTAITATLSITNPESGAQIAAAGAQIRILDDTGDTVATAVSDTNGVLVLEVSEPGDYIVELVVESLPEGTIVTSENPTRVTLREGAAAVTFGLEVGPTDEEICADAVSQVAVATADMAAAFGGQNFADLGVLARTGPTALPGVPDFLATLDDLAVQLGELDCPEDEAMARFRELVAAVASNDAISAFVLSGALASVDLGGEDPVEVVMQALALYPQHDPVPPPDALAGQLPKWIVILESLEVGDYTEAAAQAIAEDYTGDLGIVTNVLRSDDYQSMNAGYWVVYTGWFDDREEARNECSSVRSQVDFCYERYVQTLPSVGAPYGLCGPYGRFNVSGVARGNILRVYLAPSAESAEIGSYSRTATGILAAGPAVRVNTTRWLPVVVGSTIGWAEARFLASDPACSQVASIASCADLAAATVTLVVDIVGAAEVVDTGGLQAAASLDRAGFDVAASGLSTAASALGCDVVELNAMVDDGLVGLATGGPFSAMVRNMLTAQDFFVAG